MKTLSVPVLAVLALSCGLQAQPARWPVLAERTMAADASFYAPPDFKRQIARHRDRLMAGVTEAAERERSVLSVAEHQAAAAERAGKIVSAIRQKQSFTDVVAAVGVLVHSVAMSYPPSGASQQAIDEAYRRRSGFLGYSGSPFSPKAAFFPLVPARSSPQAAYDSAVTAATRLLAWIWNAAGGDASIVTQYPESKGPYGVR